ncbi:hypothetical protein [Cereibacter sphaeroides]|nr:hypothetical protein [Cereibacter sphaeroides]
MLLQISTGAHIAPMILVIPPIPGGTLIQNIEGEPDHDRSQ